MSTPSKPPSKNAARFEHIQTNLLLYKPTGMYYIKYKLGGKKRIESLDTKNLILARRKLATMLSRIRSGKVTGGSGKQLRAVIEMYKKWLEGRTMEERTRETRLANVKTIEATFPNYRTVKLTAITKFAVETWRDAMHKTKLTKRGTPYSVAQVNQCLCTLRQIFKYAEDKGLLFSDNPVIPVKQLPYRQKRIILPNNEQVEQLRASLAANSPASLDLFDLLCATGIRIESAQNVKWEHVDYRQNVLHVDKAKRGGYSVPIFPKLKRLLDRLLERNANPDPQDRIVKVNSAKKVMNTSCRRLGIPRMTHHSCRHLFCTIALESGVDIKTLAEWLGHKDGGVLVLKTYGHLRKEHSQAQAKLIK
jgi:integrase